MRGGIEAEPRRRSRADTVAALVARAAVAEHAGRDSVPRRDGRGDGGGPLARARRNGPRRRGDGGGGGADIRGPTQKGRSGGRETEGEERRDR